MKKITQQELQGKGNIGMPDTPEISTLEMQKKLDELSLDVIIPAYNRLVDELTINGSEPVKSTTIGFIRVNENTHQLEYSLDGVSWQGTASSGHRILNSYGDILPQRGDLQFVDTVMSDDGSKTIIKGIKGIQGEKGDTGAQGVNGIQGVQGEKGVQGIQGIQGLRGEKGDTGDKGIQGERGVQGVQGIQGIKGEQGLQGVTGQRGEQGLKGDRGIQGERGVQGLKGVNGLDGRSLEIKDTYPTYQALRAALPMGDNGTYMVEENQSLYIYSERQAIWDSIGQIQGPEGPQGLQGEKGVQGEQGARGERGQQGERGIQGAQGERGSEGVQGLQGIQGVRGEKGEPGAQGAAGARGLQGLQGVKGAQGIQGGKGDKGDKGDQGVQGIAGQGVLTGGAVGQFLQKKTAISFDTQWKTLAPIDIGAASTATYSANINTSWAGGAAPYTQTVAISGILASDNPIVDAVLSTNAATAKTQLEAWGSVDKIVTGANSITVTCFTDKPKVIIPIQLKVVR